MRWNLFLFVIILNFILIGCKQNNAPDVSHIPINIEFNRWDKIPFEVKGKEELTKLQSESPNTYNLYFNQILQLKDFDKADSVLTYFNTLRKDSLFLRVNHYIKQEFNSTKDIEREISQMYKYISHYFGDKIPTPELYSFYTDFGYQLFLFETDEGKDAIGISLEMFLHRYIDYKSLDPNNNNFSDYITRTWDKAHITRKIAELAIDELLGPPPGMRLLDHMIHSGKKLYIMEQIIPGIADSVLHEYTKDEVEFCQNNSLQMWHFFLDKKLFYETNMAKIQKYIAPSPSSPDMPPGAPGRTANYLGYKVVGAFMKRYPETTLIELIEMKDSAAFLEKSKYKPKQK